MSANSQPFIMQIMLSTPVIIGRRFHLDALLAYMLVEEYRLQGMSMQEAVETAHANVPLKNTNGVAHGSAAIIPRCASGTCVIVNSIERHLRALGLPKDNIAPLEQKRRNSKPYGDMPSPDIKYYETLSLEQGAGLFFLGLGDMDAIQELITVNQIDHIGKKRNIGYGRIREIRLQPVEDDNPLFGLILRDGTVLRAVPKDILDDLTTPTNYAMEFETYKPPYWQSEGVTLCYVPPRRLWPAEDIDELVANG